ncbi:MAG: ABC transporter ATP-binding protein [Massilia sp.]
MSATSAGPNPHWQRLVLLRGFAGRLCAGLLFMSLTVMVELAYPKALAYFIDHIDLRKQDAHYGGFALLVVLALAVQAVATTLRYYLFETTGQLIVAKIRRLLYGALIAQPIGFFDKHNVGELTNRLANDVEILQDTLTMGLAISLRSLCVFLGCAVMLVLISPPLSLILAVFLPLSLIMGKLAGRRIGQRPSEIQTRQADCGRVAHEHFTNVRLVHAFNQRDTALARYADATRAALQAAMATTRMMASFRGISSFLMYMALVATLWFGAQLIGQGRLTVGALTSFVIYAGMATSSSGAVTDFWSDWMRTIGATARVFEIIDSEAGERDEGNVLAGMQGGVAFRDLVFSYPERPQSRALDGVSFQIAAGEKVALVGASGAGKSTVANLILRFYQPDSGMVLFDGHDAQRLSKASVRAHLAIVEQEPSLFSGSIFDNIAFALDERIASRAEVAEAARLANAHDFIAAFPDGYDTLVGDRGVQLSGGQKQRIAIARAVLRDPRILILDEATSALDAASERQVQQALDTLMEGRTTIIIAHRYSTIIKADRALVFAQGRLVQQGAHAALMHETDGVYHNLMANQLGYRSADVSALRA